MMKQLFAFERVALQPGESAGITLNVSSTALMLVTDHRVAAPGKYTITFSIGDGIAANDLTFPVTV